MTRLDLLESEEYLLVGISNILYNGGKRVGKRKVILEINKFIKTTRKEIKELRS